MNRSSLTEETPSTPGWVDVKVRQLFAELGNGADEARDSYASCLAGVRGNVDVDAGHDRCRRAAVKAVEGIAADPGAFDRALQALEAEISRDT